MNNFQGFERPNTTPVPNVFLDQIAPELTGAEIKVALYLIRRIYGFQKESDSVSLSQFCDGITTRDGRKLDGGTGLSRSTVIAALSTLTAKGYVLTEKTFREDGGTSVNLYRISVMAITENPTPPQYENHTTPSTKIELAPVRKSNPQNQVLQNQGNKTNTFVGTSPDTIDFSSESGSEWDDPDVDEDPIPEENEADSLHDSKHEFIAPVFQGSKLPDSERKIAQVDENPEKPAGAVSEAHSLVPVPVRSRTPGKLIAKPDPAKKAGDSSGFAEIFERDVWRPYTRPGASKAAAMKICAALSMQEWAALLGALKAWHPHWQEKVKNGEGQYVKHLDRWIKDQRADGFTARPLPDAPRAYSAAQERAQEHAPKPKEVIPPKAPTGRIITQEEQDDFVARLQQWKKDQNAG